MSLKNPNPGIGFVPEYQVSSWPYVTSSQIHFGFTENCFLAVNSNFYCLHAGESTARLELKCKEVKAIIFDEYLNRLKTNE